MWWCVWPWGFGHGGTEHRLPGHGARSPLWLSSNWLATSPPTIVGVREYFGAGSVWDPRSITPRNAAVLADTTIGMRARLADLIVEIWSAAIGSSVKPTGTDPLATSFTALTPSRAVSSATEAFVPSLAQLSWAESGNRRSMPNSLSLLRMAACGHPLPGGAKLTGMTAVLAWGPVLTGTWLALSQMSMEQGLEDVPSQMKVLDAPNPPEHPMAHGPVRTLPLSGTSCAVTSATWMLRRDEPSENGFTRIGSLVIATDPDETQVAWLEAVSAPGLVHQSTKIWPWLVGKLYIWTKSHWSDPTLAVGPTST